MCSSGNFHGLALEVEILARACGGCFCAVKACSRQGTQAPDVFDPDGSQINEMANGQKKCCFRSGARRRNKLQKFLQPPLVRGASSSKSLISRLGFECRISRLVLGHRNLFRNELVSATSLASSSKLINSWLPRAITHHDGDGE